ncbi:hypothetical protein Tco_1100252, partial [Tanacetum coccineum]
IPVIYVVRAEVPIAPTNLLVAPEVGVVSVISPTVVLDLVYYSSSCDSDPSKDSLPVAPELPLVSPFLCFDDSEVDSESEPAEQRPERHESLASSSEFPFAPAIPFDRPYRTHPNGPCKLLTARKRVGPFPAYRLTWRRVSHRSLDRRSSPDFTSDSSSSSSYSDSTSVHSSGCDASGQSHSGPSTRVASLRLVDPPSSLDSSSKRSLDLSSPYVGPSRKRCRSPTTLVPLSTLVLRSIAPALADLSPCKSSYKEEFEAEASTGGTMEIVVDPLVTSGISEPTRGDAPDLEDTVEAGQLVANGERVGLADRVRSLGRENLRVQALLCIERDHVDSLCRHMALSQEEFRQIRRDHDDTRRRLKMLESLVERHLGFCL